MRDVEADALSSQGVVSFWPGFEKNAVMDECVSCESNRDDSVERLRRRLGSLDPQQVAIWRQMSPARKLQLVFQAHQFALEIVRTTERRNHPHLPPDELNWRVVRRMHGDLRLGRGSEVHGDG